MKNCRVVFQSVCTVSHSHQQCMSAPIPLQPHQLLLPVFLIIAVLVDVKWYVIVALNIINDVKHNY